MITFRLVLEYRGNDFHGWQKQPGLRTVQGELQKALEVILRQPISSPVASGRTDAGVHARRQVVCCRFEPEGFSSIEVLKDRLARGVSSILRNEVRVLKIEEVSPDFHPVHDALRKQYSYH
ncbi:MAG: hypothetical protein KDD60_11405, partial [Bdellovibrionales bacterium]|nr:hypothetical protein [Bdellovibrionales bacterium]